MTKSEKAKADLIAQAKAEGWDMEKLANEIWDAAVDWAGDLVDYDAVS